MRKRQVPYRIIGAYDSETSNITVDGVPVAYPILHQLGIIDDVELSTITPDNVENCVSIELYRHTFELYDRLDVLCDSYTGAFVPVIMCHNLSFDMYGLASWLNRHDVRVLAKSPRKPISFTIRNDDGVPVLVIWDTLIFTQQSLSRMGEDCGYNKLVGAWDYDLVRTPETHLTADEIAYAEHDIYALIAWLGWWVRRNPDIEPGKLGLNVVTKTGIVRERRKVRFENHKASNSKQYTIGKYWYWRCNLEAPKSDDELFTMLACTRGGLTFCASKYAGIPYDLDGTGYVVAGYDATSQHPAQLVSSYVPYYFHEVSSKVLDMAFSVVGRFSVEHMLTHWDKPFPTAFNACFRFTRLRPKSGSLYERHGIYPLASARFGKVITVEDYDNGDKSNYEQHMSDRDYKDKAINPTFLFGKLVSADVCEVYLTELAAWEVWQCYEWDNVQAIHGYETGKYTKPNDIDIVSVMAFYRAKDLFKQAREEYYQRATISNGKALLDSAIPESIVRGMEDGTLSDIDVEATYLSLKADLNAIFGISASNEYRRDTVLGASGIEYEGEFGICNKPKTCKVWYQFGQRIVGKSRIAQICAMELLEPYAKAIINGDTDSIKILVREDDLGKAQSALDRLGAAIDNGKAHTSARIKTKYPKFYDDLQFIGHYEHEFTVTRYCASWNKAYCYRGLDKRDGKYHYSFTLAGIPANRGVNQLADKLADDGWSFEQVCNVLLGYNVTYTHDLIKLNARKFPEWASEFFGRVTDYRGETRLVAEPHALALYSIGKTVNDTHVNENYSNMVQALANNPGINTKSVLVTDDGVIELEGWNDDD